jgi:hypothetical protein
MANDKRTNDTQEDLIDRTPRTHDNRETEARASDAWVPPALLPMPNPQPGWTFRYVRTSTLGKQDNTNVSGKFREGWQPVKASEVPELQIRSDRGSTFPENIEIGGLLLCKIPDEVLAKRRKYYLDMAQKQMEAVDRNYMREQDRRMPLSIDKQTRTTFGRS